MNPTESASHQHWLFVIRTDDRPGGAASIIAAFSGCGLQIENFAGMGDAPGVGGGWLMHGPPPVVDATLRSRSSSDRSLRHPTA